MSPTTTPVMPNNDANKLVEEKSEPKEENKVVNKGATKDKKDKKRKAEAAEVRSSFLYCSIF